MTSRRNILKGLLGGVVAAPVAAQAVVAQTVADLSIPGVGIGMGGFPVGVSKHEGGLSWLDRNKRDLAKLIGMTMEQHKAEIGKTSVHALDPDLAVMRGVSIGWKMRQQQERNYWRQVEQQKGWFQRIIEEESV